MRKRAWNKKLPNHPRKSNPTSEGTTFLLGEGFRWKALVRPWKVFSPLRGLRPWECFQFSYCFSAHGRGVSLRFRRADGYGFVPHVAGFFLFQFSDDNVIFLWSSRDNFKICFICFKIVFCPSRKSVSWRFFYEYF